MEEMHDRPYRMPDADALMHARILRTRFLEHQADFTNYDPDFADPFASDWDALIEQGLAVSQDEWNLFDQVELTTEVSAAIKLGRSAMVDLRFFAHKAFGTRGYYKTFNFKQHDRMTRQPANYIIYLKVQHAMALKFAAKLSAKGMTPAQMDALATAANQLDAAELAQELYKRERACQTVERKDAMARMWAPVQSLNRTAEIIYADNDHLREKFGLEPRY